MTIMRISLVAALLLLIPIALPASAGDWNTQTAATAPPSADAATSPPVVDPMKSLAGRWAGEGSAHFKSGESEDFKCVATYFLDGASTKVKQNLRCKSPRFEISLVSNWDVADGAITGNWEETKYDLKGKLMGNVAEDGFSLFAENEFASAAIAVKVSACEQAVTMTFDKQVELLTANLKKC